MADAVFDLDALAREANKEPFRFRFDGAEYELGSSLDIRVGVALQAGRLEEALNLMLGDEQWARLNAAHATFGVAELEALLTAWAAHTGITLPE